MDNSYQTNQETDDIREQLFFYKKSFIDMGKLQLKTPEDFITVSKKQIFILGLLKRSIDIIEGFISLIDTGNRICVIAIIQVYMDTFFRISYLTSLKDPGKFGEKMINEYSLIGIKEMDGNIIALEKLVNLAAHQFEWFEELYNQLEEVACISEQKAFIPEISVNRENPAIFMAISDSLNNTQDMNLKVYYQVMIQLSKGILELASNHISK